MAFTFRKILRFLVGKTKFKIVFCKNIPVIRPDGKQHNGYLIFDIRSGRCLHAEHDLFLVDYDVWRNNPKIYYASYEEAEEHIKTYIIKSGIDLAHKKNSGVKVSSTVVPPFKKK